MAAGALALLVLLAAAPAARQEPAPPAAEPPPPELAQDHAPAPEYLGEEGLEAAFARWLGTGLCERMELGRSAGGRPIRAVVLGGAGATPLAERPTILVVGGLDGISLAGAEAVVAVVDALLAAPERLPAGAAFVAVPWANPDGLARWRASGIGGGRNDEPTDGDRDGALDEDPPDDVDGDGLVLEMLVPDPEGPWTRAADDRLLRPARTSDAPRYRLAREGRDDDGDGRFNEDGPGGIVPDLAFPLGWRGAWRGLPSGELPLAAPEARALADLALGRRVVAALLLQGSHGELATPGGRAPAGPGDPLPAFPLRRDASAYEELALRFARATGRAVRRVPMLAEARGEERPGAAVDWLYGALGVLACEVAPWGPEVEAAGLAAAEGAAAPAGPNGPVPDPDSGPEASGAGAPGGEEDALGRHAPPRERAWAEWLDNTRGGIGFTEWQPVELGGQPALVGGWHPRTRVNPPPAALPHATRGLAELVLEVARGLPTLAIDVREARREPSGVTLVRARVRNEAWLPTGVGPLRADDAAGGVVLEAVLPEGARLLAGTARAALGHLPGRAASAEHEWVLVLPEGAALRLVASAPWTGRVVREVRP